MKDFPWTNCTSVLYRITERLGLEGTLKISPPLKIQLPYLGQGLLPLDQVALKATSNMALDMSGKEAFTASLGNLFQCLTTLTVNNFCLIFKQNLPLAV